MADLVGEEVREQRVSLAAEGSISEAGKFEVMAITAGVGNGWEFGADCLEESLSLWDGAECFVDHAWAGHSLRDLGGVLHSPAWDGEKSGIKCQLRAVGPSARLLEELGRELVGETAERRPRVGFSADVIFTAQGRKVEKILRVLSVDLVFNPARGGAFLRALNSIEGRGVFEMADEEKVVQPAQPAKVTSGVDHAARRVELSEDLAAVRTLLDVQREQAQLAEEAEQARKVRAEMCGYLLESGLAASKLPAPLVERVRKQFAGRVFEPQELTQAIEDGRKMVSELTGPAVVQGPGRIHAMYSSEDQLNVAVHDLLGAERPDALKTVKSARLSGVRELYTLMTGDVDFHGGYNADRAQFSTTADLPALVANVLNKIVTQEWRELGRSGYRWWEPIVQVEHFNNLQAISGMLVGEVTTLPVVLEGAAYAELALEDVAETGTWVKYGGYIGLTLEIFERDETHKVKAFPKKLASAGLRRISALVSACFTAGGGVGPLMADGTNVFAVARGNLGVAALSSATWETASGAIFQQEMVHDAAVPAPPVLALDAKYLLVPRELRLTGMQLLYPDMERTATFFSENMQKGQYGDVITVPEWTDASDWAAVADPKLAPAIYIGERFGLLPEIIIADGENNGALFTNDEMRLKARHWLSVFVADYRPLYKANVP